jgi:glycosyltransferase involved in cell wall biosynthesis
MTPSQRTRDEVDISVVIPVLDERESLPELHRKLTRVLRALQRSYEIIFVDDGSTDGSAQECREIIRTDPHVVLVEFRRHFGKATALQGGFLTAGGRIVITMDADLQDEPEEIPRFLEALDNDLDVVSGWKKDRKDPFTRRLSSRIFNLVTSTLTGIRLRDFNCGYKAYRAEVTRNLELYGELHRYIPVLAHGKGFRIGEIAVVHHPRRYGKTKYRFDRFTRGMFDLVTTLFLRSYERRPMHLFGFVGAVVALVGVAINGYLSVLWFSGEYISQRPLLMLGTLLIGLGIQIGIFGLLAELITSATFSKSAVKELIARVHQHGSERPEDAVLGRIE